MSLNMKLQAALAVSMLWVLGAFNVCFNSRECVCDSF